MKPRPIKHIAAEICEVWRPVNYGARPYLEAMLSLNTIEDDYYLDSADSIIRYFLGNARTWRGEDAKRIKK